MPTISLHYRMPGDIDLQSGLMFNPKQTELESNIFFNGIYQVNKVESRVNNGAFTQMLYCTRLNNQIGPGEKPTEGLINIFRDYEANKKKEIPKADDGYGVYSGDVDTGVVD